MAMALQGSTRHYKWDSILPRHFLTTAKAAGYSEKLAREHMNEMFEKANHVIKLVKKDLPKDFPKEIAEPIFAGLRKRAEIGLHHLAVLAEQNKRNNKC